MRIVPRLEQDDLDRWITQVLTASTGDARPPEQVWQRIVCHVVSADQNPQARIRIRATAWDTATPLRREGGDA